MRPTNKTNECLRQLDFVRACYPIRELYLSEKFEKGNSIRDKQNRRQIFEAWRDSLWLGVSVLMFRCLSPQNITFNKEPTDESEPIGGIPAKIVWDVCNRFEYVSPLDLENELYDIIDTPKNLPQYKELMYKRFKDYLTYPREIENRTTLYTQLLVDKGIISDYEQELFVMDLNRFSFRLKCVVSYIRGLYSNGGNDVEIEQAKQPNFRDCIQYNDPNKLLQRLHQLVDGKSGADVGCVFLAASIKGLITRLPTKSEYESEFFLKGSWSAIHNYMDDNNENALSRANRIVFFD